MSISQFALFVGEIMGTILVTRDDGQTFRKYDPKEIKRALLYTYQFLIDDGIHDKNAAQIPDEDLNEIIERVGTQVENMATEIGTGSRKMIKSSDLHFLVAFQLMKTRFKEVAYWYIRKVGDF